MSDALPILDELGNALAASFQRVESQRAPRLRLGLLLPAAAAFVLVGGGAAAATLLALRGSVIPGPSPADVQPQMRPIVNTAHVEPIRAADPAGGAPWTVRIARSQTGLVCTTAGQLVNGQFGIIGLDGHFRELAPDFADGCGQEQTGRASLMGARVFYSPHVSLVRTVIDGIAGPQLKSAELLQDFKRPRALPVSADGAFVAVSAGYPEDVGARVVLRFRDGHVETQSVGRNPFVVPDPAGGRAWRVSGFTMGGRVQPAGTVCASFGTLRQTTPIISGPQVCGPNTGSHYFFAIRRFKPGDHGRSGFTGYDWHHNPPRTVIWGAVGSLVKAVTVLGPRGAHRALVSLGRNILAVYPGNVHPRQLTVKVRFADGSVVLRKGDTNLIPFPRPKHR